MKKHEPHIKYLKADKYFAHGWREIHHPPYWITDAFKLARWVVYEAAHSHWNAIPYLRGRHYIEVED